MTSQASRNVSLSASLPLCLMATLSRAWQCSKRAEMRGHKKLHVSYLPGNLLHLISNRIFPPGKRRQVIFMTLSYERPQPKLCPEGSNLNFPQPMVGGSLSKQSWQPQSLRNSLHAWKPPGRSLVPWGPHNSVSFTLIIFEMLTHFTLVFKVRLPST